MSGITNDSLLSLIRNGEAMSFRQQLSLTVRLSVPAVLAQLSSIMMQYIDASMVGRLGAEASASIGLVSTTTWLFMGLCSSFAMGFSVLVAHRIGAGDMQGARTVLRQAITFTAIFSITLAALGFILSGHIPYWLGGNAGIIPGASAYLGVFMLALPLLQMNFLAGGMLRCSGNMTVPSVMNVIMCCLDVVFNFFLIFPTREIHLFGMLTEVPGAGLGVRGAALGTLLAELVAGSVMLLYLCLRSPDLRLDRERGSFRPKLLYLRRSLGISLPMGAEHGFLCGAQILTTVIVAPLGTFSIAANAFAVTAESLCYMPGHGIAEAATTLVGQSTGAGRRDLMRRFAHISVYLGVIVMTVMGIVMYLAAPLMMGIMTPVQEIRDLGVMALRIEAFAEPLFAASIVSYGVFVGAGDTLVPCGMNLFSIWAVRLSLAALLAPVLGLRGVWIAMCVELCFRGMIFLIRLHREKWIRKQTL